MTTHTHGGRAAPGAVIGGRYALRSPVGHGGMGTVWRASDTVLRREVAVKEVVLPPGLADTDRDAMYERTFREARAAASLSHPSVVQVFDVVTEAGRPWIVMEMLDARSLADMVIEDGPLSPRAVAKVGVALLGALEVAHAGGVLHRDVKPANVLITTDGRCVLTDFGVAKLPTDVQLTTPGMVLGSPHFISPERALGKRFGPPSDLFSLGVTLYTAVEGRPPFDKGDPLGTMHSVVEDPPLPPRRCGPLVDVLYGLMEKDPARRWDVPTSRAALRELLAGPLAQHPPVQQYQAPEQPQYEHPQLPPQHTDPWAVVNAANAPTGYLQHPSGQWEEPQQPRKRVGGRAMLHTGETPESKSRGGGNRRAVRARAEAGSKRVKLAVGAGAVAVLLIATVSWAVMGDDEKDKKPTGQTSSPSAEPSKAPVLATRAITFNGVSVNVPKDWKESKATGFVDYIDPTDSDRWIRINVNSTEKDARKALESADRNFPTKYCAPPGVYQKLALSDAVLGGVKGAQLEYQCTPDGKQQKHGLWRIAIIKGKACHVYLSTWESTYAKDKAVFEAALASFQMN